MINLKIFNNIKIKVLLIIIFLLFSLSLYAANNRIVFKINDNAFTLLDIKKRIDYLNFVGNNNQLNKKIIIDDYISANLFFEYYNKNINSDNYNQKIIEIFNNINKANEKNNRKFNFIIDKENIIENIRLDYIRKIVLESVLNSSIDQLKTSKEEIDLLYKIKLKYININKIDFLVINKELEKIKNIKIQDIIDILNENEINYFFKEKEIYNVSNVDERIRNNIISNKKYFIIQNSKNTSIIYIDKSFETFDGMIVDLYSVRSKQELNSDFLKCDNLINKKNASNIINKEYKIANLNDKLKNNLVNINDYYKYMNNNDHIYIILCDIKFNSKKLQNVNLNKLINRNVDDIEKKFIRKYSEVYNLIKFDA
tara:strand:- start:1649 stop:2755 length:1107 start_codon:yes stop_codon:yes gene_type:complete